MIRVLQGHSRQPEGGDVHVVIDVLRAFTVSQIVFDRGAASLCLVATVEEALGLKEREPDRVLVGEVQGYPIPGFDYGNSPAELTRALLRDRHVVLRTTNGVAAAHTAQHAPWVLLAGFGDAERVADYVALLLEGGQAKRVNLIASSPTGDEDLACAELIRSRLLGESDPSVAEVRERILRCAAAKKFLDPEQPEFCPEDLDLCARVSPTARVLRAKPKPGLLEVVEVSHEFSKPA